MRTHVLRPTNAANQPPRRFRLLVPQGIDGGDVDLPTVLESNWITGFFSKVRCVFVDPIGVDGCLLGAVLPLDRRLLFQGGA